MPARELNIKWPSSVLVLLLFAAALSVTDRGQAQSPFFDEDPLADFRKQTQETLGKELREAFPEIPSLLFRETAKSDNLEIREPLRRLLEAQNSAPPERRPALLLAADILGGQLWCDNRESLECRQLRDEMAVYKLTWAYSELGGGWYYHHDLLWRLWKEYGTTPWGEIAFVMLLDKGWDTTGMCTKGSDQFRDVIREGDAFLAERLGSPHRAWVRLLEAEAYETWWSLSRANPKEDDYATPETYKKGATQALEKAIAAYQEVIKTAPGTNIAAIARRQLKVLKPGGDTGQRKFFCVYD